MSHPDTGQPHNLPALPPQFPPPDSGLQGAPGHYAGPPVHPAGSWRMPPRPGVGPYGPPPMPPQQYAPPATVVVTPKSPGVAVLLSFLWLGAGHLYCNRIGVGIVLALWDAFLVLLSLTLVGWIVSGPLWIISVIPVMIFAARAAEKANQRNGLIVR